MVASVAVTPSVMMQKIKSVIVSVVEKITGLEEAGQ